jgi:shikimate dehydrogenase
MHNAAFRALGIDAVYVPLRVEPAELRLVIRALALAGGGGNVTVPHKEHAAGALDRPSPRAAGLQACNTFWGEGGLVAGENTAFDGSLVRSTSSTHCHRLHRRDRRRGAGGGCRRDKPRRGGGGPVA